MNNPAVREETTCLESRMAWNTQRFTWNEIQIRQIKMYTSEGKKNTFPKPKEQRAGEKI